MAAELIKKELFSSIPIEDIISEQDCIKNMSSLCNIRQTRKGIFFSAKKILNITPYACDTQWEIGEKPIGEESSNGLIYKGQCDGNHKEYVLKYIDLRGLSDQQLRLIAKEINAQQLVYKKTGFTTPVYQIFINDDYLMFITDKLKTTVYRYFIEKINHNTSPQIIDLLKKIAERCYDISVDLMKNHNIFHGDEHFNNFMLTNDFDEKNFDPLTIKIIDFGKTVIYQNLDKNTNLSKLKQRLESINSFIDFTLNDFRYNKPLYLKSISDLIPNNAKYHITPQKSKSPRKWSREYCKKTPCKKMGFSQKASCRPYKNCYKSK